MTTDIFIYLCYPKPIQKAQNLMSRLANTLGVLIIAALSVASCSTILPKSNKATTTAEVVIDSTDLAPQLDTIAPLIETPASEMMVDSVIIDSLDTAEMQPLADELEAFHFEGKETSTVMIDEFRGMVLDDITLSLSDWASAYPADGHVTSPYGWRRSRMHAGIDLKAYTGDNLYAAFDGVVRLAKYYGSYGNCIVIRHYNGLETVYGHASKILVNINDQVKAGDVIALAGNTGRSTGSHLHFEVRVGGNYFNPTLILDTDNRKIKDCNLYITMRNGRLFASNNDSEEEREAYILQQISIRYYTVKKGDILSRIAVNNGTTVATICRLNGIKSTSTLRIGQRLIVRDGIKPPATTSAAAPTTTSAAKESSTKASTTATNTSTTTTTYRVKSGDTLSQIAQKHGTTITALCNLNGISRNSTLQINQRLQIPGSGAVTQSSSAADSPTYYKVKKGDTLSGIAKRNGTTVAAICNLNGISKDGTLQINQRLRIK